MSAAAAGLLIGQTALASPKAPQLGTIFVIAMENHNFTQPATQTSPAQIFGNPAAPFMNSLVTPGDPNAAQVSFATTYFNAGNHVHPSEPNYVWAEAGTDFAFHSDADPKPSTGNIFDALHLTAQFDRAGIPWNNYQEDVQLSSSPLVSASGSTGPVNPFYGTTQFNYAAKHNPMVFFTDTPNENLFPFTELAEDIASNTFAEYNWITPNQFNDAHSSLKGGFTYRGVAYTGDQASVAQGDNFLSQIVPQIMATPAYQNNGVIVIWWDETEGGDDASRAIPEIVISPLAKGNAYASSVPMSHSSDIKTWEEVFDLSFINNPIPTAETYASGGYQHVATANDLSDLFVPGVIPTRTLSVKTLPAALNPHTHHATQVVLVTNTGDAPAPAPLWLVLDNLTPGATLLDSVGTSAVIAPLGSPYVKVRIGAAADDGHEREFLLPHETQPVVLHFDDATNAPIDYQARVLSVTPAP